MDINNVVLNTLCEVIASQKNKIKELENKILDKDSFINFISEKNRQLEEELEYVKREKEKE